MRATNYVSCTKVQKVCTNKRFISCFLLCLNYLKCNFLNLQKQISKSFFKLLLFTPLSSTESCRINVRAKMSVSVLLYYKIDKWTQIVLSTLSWENLKGSFYYSQGRFDHILNRFKMCHTIY